MNVRSYAKINLGLRILKKRTDGFHELNTIFHRVDLYDTLTFEATNDAVTLDTNHDDIPRDSGNLCVRAAEALLREYPDRGVHMYLEKHIPAGAGLGGGSSNAAAVLRALPELLHLDLPDEELQEIAAMLGSDVPFFLQDGSAEARGRGEVLEYFPFSSPWWILLVVPPVHVSTAWAYANLTLHEHPDDGELRASLLASTTDPTALSSVLHNDFELRVMQEFPAIAGVKSEMLRGGALGALMSGSGSAVFGLFAEEDSARTCAAQFDAAHVVSVTAPGFSPSHIVPDS
jgi:4-diphosphocytidyl-2-C-methyl-D-erythritol kinase